MDAIIDNRDRNYLPDPLIGTLLPRRYRITGSLGRGAMSVVYAGVYEPLGQPVAIKLLKSHLVSDQSTFKRFQQEAKTAGALEHPNIVGILDFGITDQGVPYLIMELLNGISLWERLRRPPALELQGLLNYFVQICDALEYTHQRGVIHRDVKPSNIVIINEDGREVLKLVDFGIAKLQTLEGNPLVSDLTATGEVFGTPLYVSPEQAMGRTLDNRADIYSLGCVLYEAVAGQPVFNGQNAFDIIRQQINNDPIPLDAARPDLRLPPSLIRAVETALEKSPSHRYQSMAQFALDLRTAMEEDRRGVYGRQAAVRYTSSSKLKAPPPVVPPSKPQLKARVPIMLYLVVWISGMLSGALILFGMDFKQKFELANAHQVKTVTVGRSASLEDQAASLTNQARAAEAQGKFDKAEKLYRDGIALSEKAYGRNDKRIAGGIQNLAGFLKRRHKNVEAASLERRALELRIDK